MQALQAAREEESRRKKGKKKRGKSSTTRERSPTKKNEQNKNLSPTRQPPSGSGGASSKHASMWAITSPRFKGLLSPRRGAKGREVSSGWITLSTKSATFTSKLGVRLPPEEKQRNLQSWVSARPRRAITSRPTGDHKPPWSRLSDRWRARPASCRQVRMVAEEAGDSAMDEVVARNLHYPAGDAHTSSTVSLGGGSPSRIGRLDTSSAALMSAYSGGCGGGTLASPRNRPNLGFAYGGVNPGPKARGQILESHDVHFSVNSVRCSA